MNRLSTEDRTRAVACLVEGNSQRATVRMTGLAKKTVSRLAVELEGGPMRKLHTRGEYAPDGPAKRLQVREEAGHRCIRCHHPFETGKHGKGEWTPCDEQCTHDGPVRVDGIYCASIDFNIARMMRDAQAIEAQWRILTVHHFDGDKANDAWWNTLALCQRCHLSIQCRVDPLTPFFLEHSEWAQPYIAGFYAWKYEGRLITREEAETRLDELLAYELRTA